MWSLGEDGGVPDELHFVRSLTARGVDLHFLVPDPADGTKPDNGKSLTYHTYPNVFRTYGGLPTLAKRMIWPGAFTRTVTSRLERLAGELKPDLILGFTHYAMKPLSIVGPRLGLPTVVKLFGVMHLGRFDLPRVKYWWKNFEQIHALRHPVDHYIVLNDGTLGNVALTRLGIDPERISLLPNGMNTGWADEKIDRDMQRNAFGTPPENIHVVTFSRLVRSKRVDLFLRAVSRIRPTLLERTSIVIGGDGPERRNLERDAERLGIGDRTVFTGTIPYRDIVTFLKASDIFVGTNELTNMSLPPCEAILCGVPVVAFDVSGTSEVVRDEETGLLVKNGDVAGLARKLELLIENGELRKSLGRRAAAYGRDHFVSWQRRLEMEIEVLERIAGERNDERA